MAKRNVETTRSQLSMLLPIVSKQATTTAESALPSMKSEAGGLLKIDDHRKAALKNLEKSGLRSRYGVK